MGVFGQSDDLIAAIRRAYAEIDYPEMASCGAETRVIDKVIDETHLFL